MFRLNVLLKIPPTGLVTALVCVGLYVLSGCVTPETAVSTTGLYSTDAQWTAVEPAEAESFKVVEYCQSSTEPERCQLFDDISSGIRFVGNSPVLEVNAVIGLEQAIEPLTSDELRLSVTTYIDDTGDELLDVLLAKRRTLSIIHHLSKRGVPLDRLQPREPVKPDSYIRYDSELIPSRQVEIRVLADSVIAGSVQ